MLTNENHILERAKIFSKPRRNEDYALPDGYTIAGVGSIIKYLATTLEIMTEAKIFPSCIYLIDIDDKMLTTNIEFLDNPGILCTHLKRLSRKNYSVPEIRKVNDSTYELSYKNRRCLIYLYKDDIFEFKVDNPIDVVDWSNAWMWPRNKNASRDVPLSKSPLHFASDFLNGSLIQNVLNTPNRGTYSYFCEEISNLETHSIKPGLYAIAFMNWLFLEGNLK